MVSLGRQFQENAVFAFVFIKDVYPPIKKDSDSRSFNRIINQKISASGLKVLGSTFRELPGDSELEIEYEY
ncbi:hypothetical protein VNO78_34311 [Psophocarpus tetragonolobus]|uniref:Uncharacterized protein n=1 Tax=Psophocarpus tetragonolobus TaxID=3891 RepID=A0AAN9RNW7_PSOTE